MKVVKESLNAEVWTPEQSTTYVSSLTVQLSIEKIEAEINSQFELSKPYVRDTLRREILKTISQKLFEEGDKK